MLTQMTACKRATPERLVKGPHTECCEVIRVRPARPTIDTQGQTVRHGSNFEYFLHRHLRYSIWAPRGGVKFLDGSCLGAPLAGQAGQHMAAHLGVTVKRGQP